MDLNKNSYISIGLAVMLLGATIWIKDGQTRSRQVAEETGRELSHYKEIQKLSSEVLSTKLDALSELVKTNLANTYTLRDHRNFSSRLQELNPTLKMPKED